VRRKKTFALVVVLLGGVLLGLLHVMDLLEGYREEIRLVPSRPRAEQLLASLLDSPMPQDPDVFERALARDLFSLHRDEDLEALRSFLQHVMLTQALGEPAPPRGTAADALRWQQAHQADIEALRSRAMQQLLEVRLGKVEPGENLRFRIVLVNRATVDVDDVDLQMDIVDASGQRAGRWREIRCRRPPLPPGARGVRPGATAAAACEVQPAPDAAFTRTELKAALQRVRAGRAQLVPVVTHLSLHSAAAGHGVSLRRHSASDTGAPASVLVSYGPHPAPSRPPLAERASCEERGECDLERKKGWADKLQDVEIAFLAAAGMLAGLLPAGLADLLLRPGAARAVRRVFGWLPVAALVGAWFLPGWGPIVLTLMLLPVVAGFWPGMLLARWMRGAPRVADPAVAATS
jgi:hypothetical protein